MLRILLSAWLVVGLSARTMAQNDEASRKVQLAVEKELKDILSEQLGVGEYFVFAVVTRLGDATPVAKADKNEGASILPFSTVKVSPGILRDILEKTVPDKQIDQFKIDVTLGFDERIDEPKRKLLEDIIRKRFGFDGQTRILTVKTQKLYSPKLSDANQVEFLKLKADTEKASLALETERSKLEMQKKELEITQLNNRLQDLARDRDRDKVDLTSKLEKEVSDAKAEAQKEIEKMKATVATATNTASNTATNTATETSAAQALQQSPTVQLARDFQLTVVAVSLCIVIVISVLIFGSFFSKGFQPLSSAMVGIGASLENAAKSIKSVGSGGGGSSKSESEGGGGGGGIGLGSGKINAGVSLTDATIKIDEALLRKIKEKIEILSREKNFSFFQIFSDLVNSKRTLPIAASILVSLDAKSAQQIVKDISMDDIRKVKQFLASESGLQQAQEIGPQALNDFYGRITMEEFLDSPLIKIHNSNWFTKMSSVEMKDLLASLGDEERPIFLALLKPQRVRLIIDECTNSKDREVIINALSHIDQVTEDQIGPFLEKLTSSKVQTEDTTRRSAVDSAKYIAQIVSELPEADQQKILASVARNPKLNEGLRDHFIPFAMIKAVPNELITEIFGERPDDQIAMMLFDASDEVRNRVIAAMPELKREGIKDEIKLLEGNKFYEKRYRTQSSSLQKEVTQYLLTLYQEGLINFSTDAQGASSNDTRAA